MKLMMFYFAFMQKSMEPGAQSEWYLGVEEQTQVKGRTQQLQLQGLISTPNGDWGRTFEDEDSVGIPYLTSNPCVDLLLQSHLVYALQSLSYYRCFHFSNFKRSWWDSTHYTITSQKQDYESEIHSRKHKHQLLTEIERSCKQKTL